MDLLPTRNRQLALRRAAFRSVPEMLDYAAQGIRVNAIAPGPILTEGLAAVGPAAQEAAAKAMPMQRIGQPAEVAAAALWLSSDESAFVTGTTVIIDGGELAGVGNFAMRKTQGAA